MVTAVSMRAPARRSRSADVLVGVLDLGNADWDLDQALRCLSPAERRRAEGAVERVRRRRILLRAALRQLAGRLLGAAPERLRIADVGGRPTLVDHDLSVSCSAQGDVGLVAAGSGGPIGVDVAGVAGEDLPSAVAEGWLTSEEARSVTALPAQLQPMALARCWAQKEAVLKAEGVGLTRHPATVHTPLADDGFCGAWALTAVPVPSGHVATVATPVLSGPGRRPVLAVQRLRPGGGAA